MTPRACGRGGRITRAAVATWVFITISASNAPTASAGCVGVDERDGRGPARVELPDGYWSLRECRAVLDKTLVVRLSSDLSRLTAGEREAVGALVEVGRIFQDIYETSRHVHAIAARADLEDLDRELGSSARTGDLLRLYYLFKGPIGRTTDNRRVPFLPVEPAPPGRNVYPWGITRDRVETYLSTRPEERSALLAPRAVVRFADLSRVAADIATLDRYPAIDALHPGLRERLSRLEKLDRRDVAAGGDVFYALPYSVAYAAQMTQCFRLLNVAASAVEGDDAMFAHYLRNRARDLLSDDYESGDASWVRGRFRRLNAQIGAYEVYDDQLYGVKAFHGLNVLVADARESAALKGAVAAMQEYENAMPYEPPGYAGGDKKKVHTDIPVGIYDVVADFGQSRGTNTATILPNESEYARKYGRTILIRANILRNADLFAVRRASFVAAVSDDFVDDLTPEGGFYRTLWHEIGHYLGPDRTADGRDLGVALESVANKLEELKADLVSLFLVDALRSRGYYDARRARAVYASGIRRTLLKNRPQPPQVYQTMELMQFNYFAEHGLVSIDDDGRVAIHYSRYHDTVAGMLREVLAIQGRGDRSAGLAFIERYGVWCDDLQGALADRMKETETYRYAIVEYDILEK